MNCGAIVQRQRIMFKLFAALPTGMVPTLIPHFAHVYTAIVRRSPR